MTEALAPILEAKRAELARPRTGLPSRKRPLVDFAAAMTRPGIRVVMECKRAAPSAGVLRAQASLDEVFDAYDGIADAVSVLTDGPYFNGSLDDLAAAAARLRVPLLRKDFILDPWQVEEAWAYGADAVLLMLSVLDDAAWTTCARKAAALGLAVLTEVHDEGELERAVRLDARIIGINNRSFRDLSVDTAVTERLAPRVPADRIVICESGINDYQAVCSLAPLVDGFLVGSALMRAPRIDLAARALVFGEVKVCGLTRAEDARAAWRAGASWGGLVFAASPRQLDVPAARAIADAVPLPMVGVFVDAAPGVIAEHVAAVGLAAVQLHGNEDAAAIQATREALPPGTGVWKAVPAGATPASGADRYLFDSTTPGRGVGFDWTLLPADRARHGLAGGLHPGNAAAAKATGVGLLDVSSGVESAPGVKSETLINDFFDALRTVQA